MIRPDAVEIAIDAQADDWLRARAEDRVRKKRHNFRQADASDAYLNYIGIRCEYALTRFLVIPFDWHLAAVQGNKGRTNLLYQGRRIDAKFTQATDRRRLWLFYGTPAEEGRGAFTADVAVLGIPGDAGGVQLVGWITRDRFRAECKIGHLPGHPGARYYVDFRNLEPMAELKDPPPPAAPAPVQGGLFVA